VATAAVALALTPSEAWAKGGQWGPLEGKASSDSAFSLFTASEVNVMGVVGGLDVGRRKEEVEGIPGLPSGKLT